MQAVSPPGPEPAAPTAAPYPPQWMLRPSGPGPRNGMILALGILSLLFVLVGTIVLRAQGLVEHDDFPSYEQYYRFLRVMGFAGSVVIGLGVFLLAMVGLITSIRRDDLPESLRRAFLVASMAVLTTWLVFFGLFGGWPYLYP